MIKKIEVGITGGIGAGKSLICRILQSMGYPVFYSDKEAKKILSSHPETKKQLISLFGNEAYTSTNALNRAFIARQVFSDSGKLNALNQIVHPAVRNAFSVWSQNQKSDLVFNEAAILFETGAYQLYDYTILVTASREQRITRVMKRDNVKRSEVEDRMAKQWEDDRKMKLANFTILNDNNQLIVPQLLTVLTQIK